MYRNLNYGLLNLLLGVLISGIFIGLQSNNCQAQERNNAQKGHDTISVQQGEDSKLQVVGFGRLHLSYTETIDGYTVVRNNEGIYEYAEQTSDGDLEASGVVAHNPGERKPEEIRYLRGKDKHLRYESPKLDELKEKQERMFQIFGGEENK